MTEQRLQGKDLAGTTWQCVGHVYRERNSLSAEVRRLQQQAEHFALTCGASRLELADAAHQRLRQEGE